MYGNEGKSEIEGEWGGKAKRKREREGRESEEKGKGGRAKGRE